MTNSQELMKITTMLLKASGYIFLVFFQVSSITILNSHYFTLFSSNFFDDLFFENLIFSPLYLLKAYPPKFFRHLNKIDLPRKIFSPLKKELNLTMVKRVAQACQVGCVLETPGLKPRLLLGLKPRLWLGLRYEVSGEQLIGYWLTTFY